MLKTLVILIAAVIVGVLIFAATKPDTFRVQRAASRSHRRRPRSLSSSISQNRSKPTTPSCLR